MFDFLLNKFYKIRLDKNFIPIHYSGFWDVPLAFLTEYNTKLYLFYRSDFDEEIDDYPPNYEIYEIKDISLNDALQKKLWHPWSFKKKMMLGEIPTKDVKFDITIRRFVDSKSLKKLIKQNMYQSKS